MSETRSSHYLSRQEVGIRGQEMAREYLERAGYQIRGENIVTSVWWEIDILALDQSQNELVFVEVKSRRTKDTNRATEALSHQKLTRLFRAAEWYCAEYGIDPDATRLDLIAVDIESQKARLTHVKNLTITI